MNFFRKLFGKANVSAQFIEFSQLSVNDRIRQIMVMGDKGDSKDFDLVAYAIQLDPDKNVRMAGLKRIENFKNHRGLKPLLLKMREDKAGEKLEPYFSMALSRTGIITLEEFEKEMNQ